MTIVQRSGTPWVSGATPARGAWLPRCDVYETAGHDLVIEADLPAVAREDVALTIDDRTLTLRATRPAGNGSEGAHLRSERRHGEFARSFVLPTTVDAGGVRAAYVNGVLRITLPVKADARPRRVPVESAA